MIDYQRETFEQAVAYAKKAGAYKGLCEVLLEAIQRDTSDEEELFRQQSSIEFVINRMNELEGDDNV